MPEVFFLDSFAERQWDQSSESSIDPSVCSPQAFCERVEAAHAAGAPLVDGYAPFCKHIFVPNFVGAKVGALEITADNRGLLESGYSARKTGELAVLTRWFPADSVSVPEATHLDVILYSREQLLDEHAAMEGGDAPELPDSPWGIISIKAQHEDYETPMQPITMMRNALGVAEGGSGVPLDRGQYDASVRYWQAHAPVIAGDNIAGE